MKLVMTLLITLYIIPIVIYLRVSSNPCVDGSVVKQVDVSTKMRMFLLHNMIESSPALGGQGIVVSVQRLICYSLQSILPFGFVFLCVGVS